MNGQLLQNAEAAPVVVGIDPSLAGFAVCVLDKEAGLLEMVRYSSKPRGKGIHERARRYREVVSVAVQLVEKHQPVAIAIEGYSHDSRFRSEDLAELGGILRHDLDLTAPSTPMYEPAPSQLKKFATGRGNAEKIAVVAQVVKKWRHEFDTGDEYDAYICARIARACAGNLHDWRLKLSKPQHEVIQKIFQGR